MSSDICMGLVFSMLQKIYWVEAHAEELVLWEALIESGEEAKQTLDTIIQDSEKHKILVQMWLNKFGIEPPASPPTGFPEKAFDFSGKDVAEMFKDILKYEILMKGMYERLLNAEYEGCIKSLIPDENGQEEFFSWVRELVNAEEKHVEMCRQNIGAFRRIMGK